jgi:uncharacterized protein
LIAFDVNVLVGAHRAELSHHAAAVEVVEQAVGDRAPFGLPDIGLSAVVRIVTSPRVFTRPSTQDEVFSFIANLRHRPNAVLLRPGDGHWTIFEDLCRRVGTRGNLVTDAWLAALAIEHGCEWLSFDRDFAKFPGLHWRHPSD